MSVARVFTGGDAVVAVKSKEPYGAAVLAAYALLKLCRICRLQPEKLLDLVRREVPEVNTKENT